MKPPKLRLIKGHSRMAPQEPDELDQAIARFLLARSAINKRTLSQYRRVLNVYRQISPDWPPAPEGIAAFIEHYQGYEPNTLFTYFSILRNFLKFCHRRRLVADDPLADISPPRRPQSLPRAPFSDDLKKLANYLEKKVEKVIRAYSRPYPWWGWREARNLCLFSLLLDSGLRVNEAVSVKLIDIDLTRRLIFVSVGKGSKQREAPFGRTTRGDIKLWLEHRALIPISPDDPGCEYLFISHRRAWVQMSPDHAEDVLSKACLRAGIERITPHQLRHAFASLSHEKGAPIARIQAWLGHTSPTTTSRYLMSREGLRDYLKYSPRDDQGAF